MTHTWAKEHILRKKERGKGNGSRAMGKKVMVEEIHELEKERRKDCVESQEELCTAMFANAPS